MGSEILRKEEEFESTGLIELSFPGAIHPFFRVSPTRPAGQETTCFFDIDTIAFRKNLLFDSDFLD